MPACSNKGERGRKEADDLPPRIVFNNAVRRPSVFWAPFLHCLAFMTAAVVLLEPVYFSLFSYCLAKIPSSAFLPSALLSAYLTYLDGYSLFVRRLSSKITRPLSALKVSPFSSANFGRERHGQVKYVSGFFLAEISELHDGFICLW